MISEDCLNDVVLDNEWRTLDGWNPIPGFYSQHGAEQVRIKGHSSIENNLIKTEYTILVMDLGKIVGSYHVLAEESYDAVYN